MTRYMYVLHTRRPTTETASIDQMRTQWEYKKAT